MVIVSAIFGFAIEHLLRCDCSGTLNTLEKEINSHVVFFLTCFVLNIFKEEYSIFIYLALRSGLRFVFCPVWFLFILQTYFKIVHL